jgi:oligopeptidase A
MRAARTFRAANMMMRQLGFAEVDLAMHIDYLPERDGDVIDYSRAILQRYSAAPFPPEHAMIAGFTHLFASPVGYAAGYYSYKWAEVLDADAFSRFRREGLFSAEVGAAFRDAILARGDSDDPMTLFRTFMGREPRLEALLERDGLLEAAA